MLDAAVDAIRGGVNQYPPGPGMPELREAIAEHQQRFYGLELDPDTRGARHRRRHRGARRRRCSGMLDAGDEVVVFEPMYDSYQAGIALAGARRRAGAAAPDADGRYGFDPDELRGGDHRPHQADPAQHAAQPDRQGASRATSWRSIAELAIEHDLIVVTDEVYEHLVFDGRTHVPIATLPGMAERTLTISSGGKTFNTTGWKIGWMTGPEPLVTAARTAKQFLTYVNGAPFQPAIAVGLGLPDDYFARLAGDLQTARDHLVAGLDAAGFTTYEPEATYFATVDIRSVDPTATAWRSAGRCPSAAAWSPSPTRCSTPDPSTVGTWCASPAASSST